MTTRMAFLVLVLIACAGGSVSAVQAQAGDSACTDGVEGCFCNCYLASTCDPGYQCSHSTPCIWRNTASKPFYCPNQDQPDTPLCDPEDPNFPCGPDIFNPECCDESALATGPCDGFCLPVIEGSRCGNENPSDIAAVHSAWTRAYDTVGARGGGPIGPASGNAYVLSHTRIRSIPCRMELERSALDLQEVCRGMRFLDHPHFEQHRDEDHIVRNISGDPCAKAIGPICGQALEAYILGRPDEGDRLLRKIPAACPDGQRLGDRCEGARDEIGCLGQELRDKATFLTTPPQSRTTAAAECETSSDCGPTSICVDGVCFTLLCL